MSLAEQIKNTIANELKIPADTLSEIHNIIEQLKRTGAAPGLAIGQNAPAFNLSSANGKLHSLKESLGKGPIIVSFYRGDWCPFCNLELIALNDIYPYIKSLNGEIIAIGPQTTDKCMLLKERHNLQYCILSDPEQKTITEYKLRFPVPARLEQLGGIDLTEVNANGERFLPVPATYVLDSRGIIRDRLVSMNYMQRMEPTQALGTARTIDFYASLFRQAPIATALFSENGTVIDFNRMFKTLFNVSSKVPIGVFKITKIQESSIANAIQKVASGKSEFEEDQNFGIEIEGEQKYLHYTIGSVKSEGNILGAILYIHDNTLETIQKRTLQKLNETKDKILSTIAHDLKNPLLAISALAGNPVAIEKELPLTVLKILHEIESSSSAAGALLEDLVVWAKAQDGQLKAKPEATPLSPLVADAIHLVRGMVVNKNIELAFLPDCKSWVYVDSTMIKTVVRNLLSNAAKFTPPGGKITVKTSCHENSACLSIEDTGVGVTEDQLTKINKGIAFSTTGSTGEKGTGFGLPLIRELVSLNKGEISVESLKSGGLKFSCIFPIQENAHLQHKKSSIELSVAFNSVLLIEDNPINLLLAQRELEANGHNVKVAKTLAEAQKILNDRTFHLVLSDYHLPDGISLPFFKKINLNLSSVVVILSADSEAIIDPEFIYLEKPFQYSTFKNKLNKN